MTNYPVSCPKCRSDHNIQGAGTVDITFKFGAPQDDEDLHNVEYAELLAIKETNCKCGQCGHEGDYPEFQNKKQGFCRRAQVRTNSLKT